MFHQYVIAVKLFPHIFHNTSVSVSLSKKVQSVAVIWSFISSDKVSMRISPYASFSEFASYSEFYTGGLRKHLMRRLLRYNHEIKLVKV